MTELAPGCCPRRRWGKTGLSIPVIPFGTQGFGDNFGIVTDDEAIALIRRAVELGLLAANACLWVLVLRTLGWWGAGLLLASQVLAGAYLSAIIAPNHTGMPVWASGARLSFLERQVLGSRNIAPHPVWDFLFGGLNYQIEHHLFPAMPRRNLPRARKIVRVFCTEHDIAYGEDSIVGSYRQARRDLNLAGAG